MITNRTKRKQHTMEEGIEKLDIRQVFSMIPGKTTKEEVYRVNKHNKNNNIGYVLTTHYTNKLNNKSKLIIDKMIKTHKTRMRKKPDIIGITAKKTIELDQTFYTKGTPIGNEFY